MTVRVAEQRWVGWQTIDTGRIVLVSCSALIVAAAAGYMALMGLSFHESQVALAFGLYIAFGELLRLVLPGGREGAPIAMSAALSYAMVLTIAFPHEPGIGVHFLPIDLVPPTQVVVVAAIGMVIGSLPHIAAGRRAGLTGMSARLVAVTCVAFAFYPLAHSLRLISHPWRALGVL
ncbi:MAG: hypothetical protein ACTHJW_05780, partial [Streptosporangiaceae bacterium]